MCLGKIAVIFPKIFPKHTPVHVMKTSLVKIGLHEHFKVLYKMYSLF